MQQPQSSSNYNPGPQLLGHPQGLFYLFFAELWERFSFYGMRALLILYMTTHLLYSDTMSIGIYAAYGSLVYATPLIGGMLAERFLGYRKSIILGGILMAMGHFLLMFEQPLFFYMSLGLIVVGNGFFKPNISSFVGKLYQENDSRRDSGFTLFYLGINIGGMIAPLLCAWLAAKYGWHYGFGLAGIGMLVGLVVFYSGIKRAVFQGEGHEPIQSNASSHLWGIPIHRFIVIASLLAVPLIAGIIRSYQYEHFLIWLVLILVLGMIGYIMTTVSKEERQRLWVVVYFTTLGTIFWSIFEQSGSSVTLFASRNIDLIGLNASQTNSINSTFIILLAIPFAVLWSFLSRRSINPNSAIKFGLGLLFLGMGFVIFALSARQANAEALTPMSYLIAGYFVLTVGEMFLSPIGLSKMTELSPPKFVSFIMGVWFLSSFFGHFFAGKIAQLTTIQTGEPNLFSTGWIGEFISGITGISLEKAQALGDSFEQLQAYVSTFAGFGCIAILLGGIALLISPWIKKAMNGVS